MWSDSETDLDLLGYEVYSNLIRDIVINPKMLPVTIGVFGDWGSGKTSIIKMLQNRLDAEYYESTDLLHASLERVACLYFNGWLFEGYDDAKSAILTAILMQLGEHKRFGPKVRGKVTRLLKSVNWMRVARLGLTNVAIPAISAYVTGGASIIPSLASILGGKKQNNDNKGDEGVTTTESATAKAASTIGEIDWESLIKKDSSPSGPLDVRSFREDFTNLIKECDIESLVVLIDDLDRCSPERIIDNLEAIKLFLNVDHTAFVIGADPRIVKRAIAIRYDNPMHHEKDEDDRVVIDYLEKLIQIPYQLPRLSPSEVETYMTLLFCLRDLSPEQFDLCYKSYQSQLTSNRYSVFRYAHVRECLGEVSESLTASLMFTSTTAPLITECLKGNPRQVKRFLNAFILRKQVAEVARLQTIREEVLVKLMILEYAEPERYRELFTWQGAEDGFPGKLKAMEALATQQSISNLDTELEKVAHDWGSSFMQRWIRITPALSDVDLRDYFWLSRDRFQDTFSGVTMVSPLVRGLVEALSGSVRPNVTTAAQDVLKMSESDQSSILSLLSANLIRHPTEKIRYDAFRALIENNVPNAAPKYIKVLGEVPASAIPAAVGVEIITLTRSNSGLSTQFQPLIEKLKGTKTLVAAALDRKSSFKK